MCSYGTADKPHIETGEHLTHYLKQVEDYSARQSSQIDNVETVVGGTRNNAHMLVVQVCKYCIVDDNRQQ